MERADNLLNLTPLWCASRGGHVDTMLVLLGRNADIHAAPNFGQDTPLHIAAKFVKPDAVDLLIQNGADVNSTDCEGNTALQVVCQKILACDQHQTLADFYSVCRLLIHNGANIDMKNHAGHTALHLVAKRRNVKCNLLRFVEEANLGHQQKQLQQQQQHQRALIDHQVTWDEDVMRGKEKRLASLENQVENLNDKLNVIDKMCFDMPWTMDNHFMEMKKEVANVSQDLNNRFNRSELIMDQKIRYAVDHCGRHRNSLNSMNDRINSIEKQQLIFKDEIVSIRETLAQLKEEILHLKSETEIVVPSTVMLESSEWVPVFQLVARHIGLKWDDLYRVLVKNHIHNLHQIEAMIFHLQELHPQNLCRQAYASLVKASILCGQQFTRQYLIKCLREIGKNETAKQVENHLSMTKFQEMNEMTE